MLVFVLLLTVGAGAAHADHRGSKLDRTLRAVLASGQPGRHAVIIQMRPGVRNTLRKALLNHGDVIQAEHPSLNALTALVHGEDLAALANDPAVVAVSSDAPVRGHFSGAEYGATADSNLSDYLFNLRATLGLGSRAGTGRGVGIAVVDSGIAPAAGFEHRISAFYDFTAGGPVAKTPYDDCGHGTHVAGLIAGSGERLGSSYRGVAPDARLVGLKVLDRYGRGRTSDVISAIDFAVANRSHFGIDIINISLGHPILEPASSDPLVQAVERAVRAGLVVVTSAGNYGENPETDEPGYAGVTSPGNAPSAITAGAVNTRHTVTRRDDAVAGWSSRGPSWHDAFAKPDVVAPGDGLVSLAAPRSLLYESNPTLQVRAWFSANKYMRLSGTSMSAAVTSGVAALVIEESRRANPGERRITPNAVKGILQYSSIPVGDGSDALTQGAGSVNGGGAIALAAAVDTTALYAAPGTSVLDGAVTPSTVIGGQTLDWGRNIVWGTRLVAGSDSLWQSNLVWGDNIVWGTRLDDENVVWGTLRDAENIVWGTAGWLENIVWGTSLLTTADGQAVVWSDALDVENIVWGTLMDLTDDSGAENIVWGSVGENVVWGTRNYLGVR